MRSTVAFLTVILMIAGCRSANDSASGDDTLNGVPGEGLLPNGTTHVFECGAADMDSIGVTVRVDSTRAWMWLPQEMRMEPVRLEQVEAASGARYQGLFDETPVLLWNRGQDALLEVGERRYDSCMRNNYRSVWEDARLDGVDFRALGNEPGWIVDVYVGERFDVQWRYGERTADLPYVEPEMPDESTTVFRSETDEHSLVMTLTAGGCTDSMSGFSFPIAVTIRIDGSEYTGCGRPLH